MSDDVDVLVCIYCETPNGEIHHPLCDVRAGKPRLYKPKGSTMPPPLTPEEAIRWVQRRGLGTPSTKWGAIADALCEAYRGEIPDEVRPVTDGS